MKVWISRDGNGRCTLPSQVYMWLVKPKRCPLRNATYYTSSDEDQTEQSEFGIKDFKAMFGFLPKKRTCKQYELSLKELK